MRLKPSSKNLANPVLLLLSLALLFCPIGCQPNNNSDFYTTNSLDEIIKKICKEEYNIDVIVKMSQNTVWVYAPFEKVLHNDYGIIQDKFFDEETGRKMNNIFLTIGRAIMNTDSRIDFFVLTVSDINLGFDYSLIGSTLDIKKSYAGSIPFFEANRRYVERLEPNPEAIGDKKGNHIRASDITFGEFLGEQIPQRILRLFNEERLRRYFVTKSVTGRFEDNFFYLKYNIAQIAPTTKKIDVQKIILDTITYCLKAYDFKDFAGIILENELTQEKITLNPVAILNRKIY